MKPVIFNNNVLRDGHQSLAATRMTTAQMLPTVGLLDSMGFGALETWGGATIDAGLRFLNEFPFDRLDTLKKAAPKTPHMMLLRGQNIVQYANFADDVVEAFVLMSAKHGMDIFRIFDALNDTRNMATAIKAAQKAGKHAQGTICYTTSPVHTVEKFVAMGVELEQLGCHSICLKDMAGLIPPVVAGQIIRGLKAKVKLPICLHTHDTAGLGATTYYAAIDAGVDMIDTSIAPFANGTGQPDTQRMIALLEGHPRAPRYDSAALKTLRGDFTKIYAELADYTSHQNELIDSDTLTYQVPGGMLSNFRTQLKEQKMEERFDEVFAEIPVVRKAFGWIPLVTPTSQIVGVQAMLNVKFGRWKNFSPQAMDLILGYYGQTPAPVDMEVQALAAKQSGKAPISVRPADRLEPQMPQLRAALKAKGMPETDEYAVIYAMFPQELEKYWQSRAAGPVVIKPKSPLSQLKPSGKGRAMNITVEGKKHEVVVEELA
jgi:pyruvate/oxaloacetate carboxyltransferase